MGSSRKSIFGLFIKDLANETLFSDQTKVHPFLSINLFKLNSSTNSDILSLIFGISYNLAYTSKFSLTVNFLEAQHMEMQS